jgi:hypothetical protein
MIRHKKWDRSSCKMNSFQVIEINNSAVAAMQQGRAKESIELLREVIANLKDHFSPKRSPLAFPSSRGTPLPQGRRKIPRTVSDSSIETQSDLSSSSSSLYFNEEEDYFSAIRKRITFPRFSRLTII